MGVNQCFITSSIWWKINDAKKNISVRQLYRHPHLLESIPSSIVDPIGFEIPANSDEHTSTGQFMAIVRAPIATKTVVLISEHIRGKGTIVQLGFSERDDVIASIRKSEQIVVDNGVHTANVLVV